MTRLSWWRQRSPLGLLVVAVSARGICRIAFLDSQGEEAVLAPLLAAVRPGVLPVRVRDARISRQLGEYFRGRRRSFALPLDLSQLPGFSRLVLARLRRVPYGRVTTYGALARAAGRPRAARAVGRALAANPVPVVVPCHRVVAGDGSLGGYTGGAERKRFLLRLEGASGVEGSRARARRGARRPRVRARRER